MNKKERILYQKRKKKKKNPPVSDRDTSTIPGPGKSHMLRGN